MKTIEDYQKIVDLFREKTRKECVGIDLIDTLSVPGIKDNKMGGLPYIPVGEEVPRTKSGDIMQLILQVNLADIDLPNWPKKGIFEIFYSDVSNCWPNEFKICVFNDDLPYYSEDELPDMPYDVFNRPWSIKLSHAETYMPTSDYRFFGLFSELLEEAFDIKFDRDENGEVYVSEFENYMDDNFDLGTHKAKDGKNVQNYWYDFLPDTKPDITLGGYAAFAQDDVRFFGTENEKLTECLFKLDSIYNMSEINLGDVGIMCGVISVDDLKNGNFDEALLTWDCF